MNQPVSGATVLVIDADPLMLTAVAAVLNLSGYECHCARDAEAALKAARGLPLDLILCDVDLDDGSGLALGQELRRVPGCQDLPLIFVSGEPAADMVRRSHDAGGVYYLRKPYDPEVLLELVEKALWMPHLVRQRVAAPHMIQAAAPRGTPAARRL
jgi:putative two-component system response regulator